MNWTLARYFITMGQCASFALLFTVAATWEPLAIPFVLMFLAGAVKAFLNVWDLTR